MQRTINASSYFEAKRKALRTLGFVSEYPLSIDKKRIYVYRALQVSRLVDGTQDAYSRKEVVASLEKYGLRVRSVRLRLFSTASAPANEVASFIGQCAKLTEQKLPFNEVLYLLAANVKNVSIRTALREINNDLRNGIDSAEAFMHQSGVFGKHVALLMGLATKSGDMHSVFESVAKLVERQAEFRKSLSSSLILPAVTALTLVAAIGYYAVSLLPRMMKTLEPVMAEVPPLTALTLSLSEIVQQNALLFVILGSLPIFGLAFYRSTPQGLLATDRILLGIPYVGTILRNTSIEIFCRVLGIMYTAGENIDAIQIAGDASGNAYFSRQVRAVAVPSMLKYGTELGKALETTNLFPEMVLSRFRTAADTGNVKATALQLADFYQTENGYALKNLVSVVELFVTAIIMLSLVFLTYLSSETASIRIEHMH
ncbi:MAG: type II secretion system F family protein [Ignavibacteriales bacterium]|nr:type II secretion system F family protein [Ignavibacteriales bacterium]